MGCPILPTFYGKTLAEFKSLVAPLLPPRPSGASKLTYTAARSVSGPISLIAFIGIILLKGHRQKNGIVMVDFALEGERKRALAPERAIFEACLERFRPIMMGRSPRCSVRFRW